MGDRFRRDQSVSEIMATELATVEKGSSIAEAARLMRDNDTGAIIVMGGARMHGLLTDRDIAVRAVAEGLDPERTSAGEIASTNLTTLDPDSTIDDAISEMRSHKVRRLPVVEDGHPVGILSLGDLATARDEKSVLADISSAGQNN